MTKPVARYAVNTCALDENARPLETRLNWLRLGARYYVVARK